MGKIFPKSVDIHFRVVYSNTNFIRNQLKRRVLSKETLQRSPVAEKGEWESKGTWPRMGQFDLRVVRALPLQS